MPGMFDGFSLNIFDDAIFDTKIQDIPQIRSRSIVLISSFGSQGRVQVKVE